MISDLAVGIVAVIIIIATIGTILFEYGIGFQCDDEDSNKQEENFNYKD